MKRNGMIRYVIPYITDTIERYRDRITTTKTTTDTTRREKRKRIDTYKLN